MNTNNLKKIVMFLGFAASIMAWQIISSNQAPNQSNNEGELYKLANSIRKASFQGDWYEVARTPNKVQENCMDGTSKTNIFYDVYDTAGGGSRHLSTTITNKCQTIVNGKVKDITYNLPAGEKVYQRKNYIIFTASFLYDFIYVKQVGEKNTPGPHPHDYVVLASDKYVWLLSRTPTIPSEIFKEMKAAAQADGANIANLIVSQQQAQ